MSYTTDAFYQQSSFFDDVFGTFYQPPSFSDDFDERCAVSALSALQKKPLAENSDDEIATCVSPLDDRKPSFDFKTVCEQKDLLPISCPPEIARTSSRNETDAQPHGTPARKPKSLSREIRALQGEVSPPSHMTQTASRTKAMYPISARRRGGSSSSSEAMSPLSEQQPSESAPGSEALSTEPKIMKPTKTKKLITREISMLFSQDKKKAVNQRPKRDTLNLEVIDAIRSGNLERIRKLIAVPKAIRSKDILIGGLVEEMKTITNPEIKSLVQQYIDQRRLCSRKVQPKNRY